MGFWRSIPRAWPATAAVLTVLFGAATAGAFAPRAPQVAFDATSLQAYLDGKGESINTLADQLDGQVWTSSVSGNASFTLMIELAGNAAGNAVGVYNVGDASPALFQVFPGAAGAGWHAMAHFAAGWLVVTLFDNNGLYLGQTTYAGVSETQFGFYLQGPGGLFFSDDGRNGGAPQALTFAGTGRNFGDWWECFEDQPFVAGASDFDDAVLMLQSVNPIAAEAQSWGAVKDLYSR
jgi:hypothetical protein